LAYKDRPDIGGTMPGEDHLFTTHVDPGSPPRRTPAVSVGVRNWWRRRVLPPGPQRLFQI